jgi:hypothetical protein
MSVSPGLSKDTVDNIVWLPSGDVDSPFLDRDPGVKCFIPAQKTPDTDLNESNETSFTSLSSVGVPNNIFLAQDFPSPSSDETSTARSTASEDIFPSPSSEPIIWIDDKNNKRKLSETEVFSKSNKSAVKYNEDDAIYRNLYKGLDICKAHPLDDKGIQEFVSIKAQVLLHMSTRKCSECDNIDCEEKEKITYSLVAARHSGFIKAEGRYADDWDDMVNNRFYRTDFHQFHQLINNEAIAKPPSECLKKLLTAIFPAPMHLHAEGPLHPKHFLFNNPNKFVFHEESMDAFFPLKDEYFMAGTPKTAK